MGESRARAAARNRSAEEIDALFRAQWNALVSSSLAFDQGADWEAARVAGAVANFLNDGSSTSLFTIIDYRRRFGAEFFDTAIESRANRQGYHPLVALRFDGFSLAYESFLDGTRRKTWTSFGRWWSKHRVIDAPEIHRSYTRRDIILTVRDKEGYGHSDLRVAELVDFLGRKSSERYSLQIGSSVRYVNGTLLEQCVRQIGHELARTICIRAPELLKDCLAYPDQLLMKTDDRPNGRLIEHLDFIEILD